MIYLDHNATTPVCPEALAAMMPYLTECWANPSSGYRFARRAKEAVATARGQVAQRIGAAPEEIVFTSGGTEADNAAIASAVALHPERRHVVTCATEHDAVLAPVAALEARGWRVTRLSVDAAGRVDLAELGAAIVEGETALVSLMWANNETGVIHPVAEAAALAHAKGVLFHTDAVQAVGKVPVSLADTPAHLASLSGHKFGAPKGIGALWVRENVKFKATMLGGGQEGDRRSGTLNVPGIVALGAAATVAEPMAPGLRDSFEAELLSRVEGVTVNGAAAPRVPNTSNVRLEGVDAQGALILLDNAGICASTGSACATGSIRPSHVLTAMGLASRPARETLRFSFGKTTTREDVARALEALEAAVKKLRVTRVGVRR